MSSLMRAPIPAPVATPKAVNIAVVPAETPAAPIDCRALKIPEVNPLKKMVDKTLKFFLYP